MRHAWPERTYFLFPGGGVEEGESPEQAAVREAREELGLEVRLKRLAAISTFDEKFLGQKQFYYEAEVVGGTFGTGDGEEYLAEYEAKFTPVLVAPSEMEQFDIKPPELARMVAEGLTASGLPHCIIEK